MLTDRNQDLIVSWYADAGGGIDIKLNIEKMRTREGEEFTQYLVSIEIPHRGRCYLQEDVNVRMPELEARQLLDESQQFLDRLRKNVHKAEVSAFLRKRQEIITAGQHAMQAAQKHTESEYVKLRDEYTAKWLKRVAGGHSV